MKHLNPLRLSFVAAVALLACTGSASATTLTSPSGTQLAVGTTIKAELKEGVARFTAPWGESSCKKSTMEGKITNAGSSTTTVKYELSGLTFSECTCHTTVLRQGYYEFHLATTPNGTMTGVNQEITVLCTITGLHCIYTSAVTHLGRIIAGIPAVFTIEGVIPRTGGTSGAFCGSSGTWIANYKVTSPSSLYVD